MARYSGEKSYYNLIRYEYFGEGPLPSGKKTNANAMVNRLPFSFVADGRYESDGPTARAGNYGSYKIGRTYSKNLNYLFTYYYDGNKNVYFSIQDTNSKNRGDSVRCVAKIGDATDSICPKGWEMARNSGSGSWEKLLINTYAKIIRTNVFASEANSGLYSTLLSFVNAGNYYISDGSRYNRGSSGYYWESNIYGVDYSYYLYFASTRFYTQYNNYRGFGMSVRCVAKLML